MIAVVSSAPSPFVVLRGAAGLLVGHVAVGNGVAGLVQRRGEDPGLSYTAAVLGGGEAVHGGNAAGLVCAALDGGGHGAVAQVLERAHTVAEAVALLRGAPPPAAPGRGLALLLADPLTQVVVELAGEGGVNEREADAEGVPEGAAPVEALIARLRELEPEPREGAVAVAALAAELGPGAEPRLHLALGPPCCAVFARHWPGVELVADESATPEGAPLARLAAAVAQATATDPELRAAARHRLDAAEAEALREGEAAERMAAHMDAQTDDRGAAVRRLVAQSHAAELARRALEELAVPAPPGSRPGPGL